jgi:hypothetical protein
MKFQKGAVYKIKIPENFDFRPPLSSEDIEICRNFWNGKFFKMTQHGCLGIETTRGVLVDNESGDLLNSGDFLKGHWHGLDLPFWKSWLSERVDKQVDTYTSPFDGQIK